MLPGRQERTRIASIMNGSTCYLIIKQAQPRETGACPGCDARDLHALERGLPLTDVLRQERGADLFQYSSALKLSQFTPPLEDRKF